MCGICGKLSINGKVDRSLIEGMCETIAHRGPDDQGAYIGDLIGLGHRRLSILDLSQAGHQPMSNPDKTLWITYNGEIYNFQEIRDELQKYGYHFQSNSDTEVVLYAYQKWGADCLQRFNGIFAFAIWDEQNQRLFLVRDRLGVKPLYYHLDSQNIIFASEIKALLQDSGLSKELSHEGILNYFTFGHSVAPNTIFRDVFKLMPGHYFTCDVKKNHFLDVNISRYWSPPVPHWSRDEGEGYYAEMVHSLLKESVNRQLISDVPLGVFLSGGLDSSIVTSLISEASHKVKTFSIGFPFKGTTYNELDDARLVAQHYGTEHHELVLDENDLTQALPALIYHFDEPFGDSAAFPTYLLSKFAREHITVSLSGEGGDEIFGGYRRYVVENFISRNPAISLLQNLGFNKTFSSLPDTSRIQKLMDSFIIKDDAERYASWVCLFNKEMRKELFRNTSSYGTNGFDPLNVYRDLFKKNGAERVNQLLYIDQQTWLPDTYLEKVDKASMAVGLEVRVPILDHKLVEFAATIPAKYKVRGVSTKYILKKAFAKELPEATLRKRKHGFAVPLDPWMGKKTGGFVQNVLFDNKARSRGLFSQEYVKKLVDMHSEGKGHYHRQLWLLIVFELWCQRFLDSKVPAISAQ
jgi:asparagine synthase (glutamine-hydrolysing)